MGGRLIHYTHIPSLTTVDFKTKGKCTSSCDCMKQISQNTEVHVEQEVQIHCNIFQQTFVGRAPDSVRRESVNRETEPWRLNQPPRSRSLSLARAPGQLRLFPPASLPSSPGFRQLQLLSPAQLHSGLSPPRAHQRRLARRCCGREKTAGADVTSTIKVSRRARRAVRLGWKKIVPTNFSSLPKP